MFKGKAIIVFIILAAVGFVGTWAVGLFEADDNQRYVSGLDFVISIGGLVLFLVAFIGMALLVCYNMGQ